MFAAGPGGHDFGLTLLWDLLGFRTGCGSITVIMLGIFGWEGEAVLLKHFQAVKKLFLEFERGTELSVDCSSKMPPSFPLEQPEPGRLQGKC